MRRIAFATALATLLLVAATPAAADDGIRWRRTTPRASLTATGGALDLRVPAGRAWGVASQPLAVVAGRPYDALVDLEVPASHLRGAFLRVALYARADGKGRQRLRLDSAPVASGSGVRAIDFTPPEWARAVKLRVLVRAEADMTAPVRLRRAGLAPRDPEPRESVLRPDD